MPCRRSTCSVQALSLPELQASRVFKFSAVNGDALGRTTVRLSQACRPKSTPE